MHCVRVDEIPIIRTMYRQDDSSYGKGFMIPESWAVAACLRAAGVTVESGRRLGVCVLH